MSDNDPRHVAPIHRPYLRNQPGDIISPTKPVGNPKSTKDFRRMVDYDDRKQSEENVAATEEQQEPASLFDLSAQKGIKSKSSSTKSKESLFSAASTMAEKVKEAEDAEDASVDADASRGESSELIDPSLEGEKVSSDEIKGLAQNNVLKQARTRTLAQDTILTGEVNRERMAGTIRQTRGERATPLEGDSTTFVSKDRTKSNLRQRARTEFDQESSDLAAISQLSQQVESIEAKSSPEQAVTRSTTLQELVDEIVKSIEIIKQQDRTDTIVRLQHPPILKDADLVLTAYEGARNEVNIAFTNLTNEGKRFLDQKLQEESLTAALREKSIVVHMLTTTTLSETPTMHSESGRFAREEERREDQRGSREQKEE